MHKFFSDYYRSDQYQRAAHIRALFLTWIPWFIAPLFLRSLRFSGLVLLLPVLILLWTIGFIWVHELAIYEVAAMLGVAVREQLWRRPPSKTSSS